MAKLVVDQAGYLITIPSLGSFRSPFKIKFPDSLVNIIKSELTKNGIKSYRIETKEDAIKPKEDLVSAEIVLPDFLKILDKLDNIELLIKGLVFERTVEIKNNIEGRLSKLLGEEEEVMFIPSPEKITEIDLEVRTSEKDDISSQVDSLSRLMNKR